MRHLRLEAGIAVAAVVGDKASGHGLVGDHHIRDHRDIDRVEAVRCIGEDNPAGYTEGAVHNPAVADRSLVAGAAIES